MMDRIDARPDSDQQQRHEVASLYVQHADTVRRIVARSLNPADQHQADDLAQDVWLTFWQYVLRGNSIPRPAGLLTTMARHKVVDHYRLARVRREVAVDTTAAVYDVMQGRELVPA